MNITPLSQRLEKYLQSHGLKQKFNKQIKILENNPCRRSLNVELLEPKNRGIHSFRIDRKYRALFFYREDKNSLEIIAITLHYQ